MTTYEQVWSPDHSQLLQLQETLSCNVQAAGLAATLCPVPADGQGKDWSERWRRKPVYGDDAIYCVCEVWSSAGNHVRV